jgi:hypothetical protein
MEEGAEWCAANPEFGISLWPEFDEAEWDLKEWQGALDAAFKGLDEDPEKVRVGRFELYPSELKVIPDGVEILSQAVSDLEISPSDFANAYWGPYGSIIVEVA